MKILLEMRPALDGGHDGIAQETCLLFRGLRLIDGIDVAGLIQSSSHVLVKGLPPISSKPPSAPTHKQLDRQSRVVISLQKELSSVNLAIVCMVLRHLARRSEKLSRFEAKPFHDFIWRSLFAHTLHVDDFHDVVNADYRIARVPWAGMHMCALAMRKIGYSLYPRLDTTGFDAMISETPYPGTVSPETKLIVRYHDAVPLLMPHTIAYMRRHQAFHYHALRKNAASGALFACVSEATRKDLLSIFPEVESRSFTIHNMVSHNYFPEESSPKLVPTIIKTRLNDRLILSGHGQAAINAALNGGDKALLPGYLLMVSTIEPRKNHLTLLAAWECLRVEKYPDLKLIVVGKLGWGYQSIVKKFRPWMDQGEVFMLADVAASELRVLYKHARATVCPSYKEGFDFSGVEAMRCGSCVAASDIAVHREIYDDATEYFNPYSVASTADAIDKLITADHASYREQLIHRGQEVSKRYLPTNILPKWQQFLQSRVRATTPHDLPI